MANDTASNGKAKLIGALDKVVEALVNFKNVALEILSEETDAEKAQAGSAMYTELCGMIGKMELAFSLIRKKLMGA